MFGRKPAPPKSAPQLRPEGGSLARMVNSAGRVDLTLLQRVAQAAAAEDFARFMGQPVLAGSAIHRGNLSAQRGPAAQAMNRTVLFEPAATDGESVSVSESLKHAIYPLVKGAQATSTAHIFAIGRIDTNDFILPDYAISKQHAVIEIKAEGWFLRDCGSTNGTFLNGNRLEKKPVPLTDKDVVGFARYEFAFLQPASLYSMLTG
ncbi:MAG: FHA domain-containing protein [Desulfobacterales bacterium]|nr:FHA domain-containing protein [Desulfobacterales bacterium]